MSFRVAVPSRELDSDETRVLNALLSLDFEEAEIVRQQLPSARVVGRCDCGCASVDLQVADGPRPAVTISSPIPPEATVFDGRGQPIGGVILFLNDGFLSMLEVYAFGQEPIREWPPSDRLQFEVQAPQE